MKCQFCNQEMPNGAKFCYKCNKQIICLGCGEPLIANSPICVYCGKEIKLRQVQANVNHIKYSETETGKSFEASFSDETAGNVVDVFAQFLPIKRNPSTQQHQSLLRISQTEDANAQEVVDPAIEINNINPGNTEDLNKINNIFTVKGESIVLYEKRLKANSKRDQQARICLLFLLYYKVVVRKEVTREDVNNILKKENIYDGGFRAWLSKHRSYIIADNDTLELSPEGEEKAKEILNEVFDKTIEGAWKSNGGSGQTTTAKVSSKRKNPQLVRDLDLMPKNKETLDVFMEHYKYGKSSPQINLLFVYYLKQILCIDAVNQDHIYTCYRHLKLTIPNDIYQSLIDTISKNGGIENVSNLYVTTLCINEVEQKMKIQ